MMAFNTPNKYRVRRGPLASTDNAGNNGAFIIPSAPGRFQLTIIASDGEDWEHVSVSTPVRCPTWEEMCFVKQLFWSDDDCVIQYHPPKSEYINQHPFCLHLWRKAGSEFETPPSYLVGYKGSKIVQTLAEVTLVPQWSDAQ